ncbi:glycine--tRNA ligase, mitochondrial 1-like protein [Tanacetum coccineum]
MKSSHAPKSEIDEAVKALKLEKTEIENELKVMMSNGENSNGFNGMSRDTFRQAVENTLQRRLFYIPSFKIYGGVAGLYDYGPPGCSVKSNVLAFWRQDLDCATKCDQYGMLCCLLRIHADSIYWILWLLRRNVTLLSPAEKETGGEDEDSEMFPPVFKGKKLGVGWICVVVWVGAAVDVFVWGLVGEGEAVVGVFWEVLRQNKKDQILVELDLQGGEKNNKHKGRPPAARLGGGRVVYGGGVLVWAVGYQRRQGGPKKKRH